MPKTKAMSLAELIRHINYDSANDLISTTKSINSEGKTRKSLTGLGATQVTLHEFAKSDYQSALYHIAAEQGGEFHSSLFLIGHDDTTVYVTEYGVLESDTSLYTLDATISGANVVTQVTPVNASTSVKFSVEFVNG